MATQTTKLGFNTWLPSDYMNVSELNANFNKIDNYVMCTKSEIISTTASNDDKTNTDWIYKEYSDGTIELYAAVRMSKIKCDKSTTTGTETAYRFYGCLYLLCTRIQYKMERYGNNNLGRFQNQKTMRMVQIKWYR